MSDHNENGVAVRLSEHEIFKIKLSQSSLTNTVVVCPTVVRLFLWQPQRQETWTYEKTGVPILIILDKTASRNDPHVLQLCLVDRTTGFATWKEVITPRSNYSASEKDFHTMKAFSSEMNGNTENADNQMAALKFPNDETAATFMKEVESYMPPDTQLITMSPKQRAKEDKLFEKERAKQVKRIKKDEISSPCMFTHVTSINNKHFEGNSRQQGKATSPVVGSANRTLSFTKRK